MHVELSLPLIGFKIFIEIRSNFDNKVIKLCALSWELNKREHFQGSHEVFHWDSAILFLLLSISKPLDNSKNS